MPSTDEFRAELTAQIDRAQKHGRSHVEINAGELHRVVGGYPSSDGGTHNMPQCCGAMEQESARGNADVIHSPPSGKGASLTMRYHLPRGSNA